jgi:prolyl-tRNA synthetase
MRWTHTLIPTLREDPSEADMPSHKLMVRAGLIRKLTAGVYSYLPLGQRALLKSMKIVREEMNRIGAVEVFLPVIHPPELWQESGRYEAWGADLPKFRDRHGRINVLGPTHEEVITHLVRNEVNSYRQLPITLFQIQTKIRDEPRPRAGVIRSREFIMKDAYSFDADDAGLDRSYQAQYDAYRRIFDRANLRYSVVEADTGLMGGRASHEFMVPSPFGEDEMVHCPKCDYSANAQKAECVPAKGRIDQSKREAEMEPIREVVTPGASTVDEVAKFLQVNAERIIKTLIFKTDKGFVAAVVRGDHEVNPSKLQRLLGTSSLELAASADVEKVTGGAFGFSGPVGLDLPVFADLGIESMQNFVAGANKDQTHLTGVNLYRDFKPEAFGDIRIPRNGDLCAHCLGPLEFVPCIEVGHIFKLGTRYSEKMKALFLDEKGGSLPIVMGCYGIGVNRIVACAIECHHDDKGILWPRELAPYEVELVSVNQKDEQIAARSRELYEGLQAAGIDTLWDDRDATAGVKFADADLLGFPVRLTVGSRTLKAGTVDMKTRHKPDQISVKLEGAIDAVRQALDGYRL